MKITDFQITNTDKLDRILVRCLELLIRRRQNRPEYWGLVAACVLDNSNRAVFGINHITKDGSRKHAERVAIERYEEKYGPIPSGSIIITTLSPCSAEMKERWGDSCTDIINDSGVRKVYCGYEDPTQSNSSDYIHKRFHTKVTRNSKIQELCKTIADSFLNQELSESDESNQNSELGDLAKKITDFLFNTPLNAGILQENGSNKPEKYKDYIKRILKTNKKLGEGAFANVFQHPVYHNVVVKIFKNDLGYLKYLNEFVIPNQQNRYVPKLISDDNGNFIHSFGPIKIVFMKKYRVQNLNVNIHKYLRKIKRKYFSSISDIEFAAFWISLVAQNKGIISKEDPDLVNISKFFIKNAGALDLHDRNIAWDPELRNPIFTDPMAYAAF